jgi:hypothetical protein
MLPRVDITLKLYNTDLVFKAVADLYVSILEFLRHAGKWYRQGRLSHSWTAFAKPWELGFRDYVEDIRVHSQTIEKLAVSSSQVETRMIREELQAANLKIERLLDLVAGT